MGGGGGGVVGVLGPTESPLGTWWLELQKGVRGGGRHLPGPQGQLQRVPLAGGAEVDAGRDALQLRVGDQRRGGGLPPFEHALGPLRRREAQARDRQEGAPGGVGHERLH